MILTPYRRRPAFPESMFRRQRSVRSSHGAVTGLLRPRSCGLAHRMRPCSQKTLLDIAALRQGGIPGRAVIPPAQVGARRARSTLRARSLPDRWRGEHGRAGLRVSIFLPTRLQDLHSVQACGFDGLTNRSRRSQTASQALALAGRECSYIALRAFGDDPAFLPDVDRGSMHPRYAPRGPLRANQRASNTRRKLRIHFHGSDSTSRGLP